MRRPAVNGIALRIALAAIASVALGVAIVALGVTLLGGSAFTDLMTRHGDSADAARRMFDESVTQVVIVAVLVAVVAAAILAMFFARMLARPLRDISRAARRIAEGDYRARVPREGPEELASLADSFNQMAMSLEEQQRMRRDFIANAAHELRTPLTNLKGYLEALRDGVIPADEATFDSLLEEADRLVRLSRSLDTLAEGDAATEPPATADVDVAAALRSAVELARPSFTRAGLTLKIDVPATLPARANPDHLAQVIANLLQNAVRYTPSGGIVTINGERRPDDVLISIANTGEAIPAADLPRVFERFYRVDKSRDRASGGAGIGLAIVQQLVEAAGGQVGVESRDGLTSFWFSLPRAAAAAARSGGSRTAASGAGGR
jgi:signal transduction histidine kinase